MTVKKVATVIGVGPGLARELARRFAADYAVALVARGDGADPSSRPPTSWKEGKWKGPSMIAHRLCLCGSATRDFLEPHARDIFFCPDDHRRGLSAGAAFCDPPRSPRSRLFAHGQQALAIQLIALTSAGHERRVTSVG